MNGESKYYTVHDEGNEPIMSVIRGQLVSILEMEGNRVEVECGDGYTYVIFADELVPSPCTGNPIPDLYFGDRVLALSDSGQVKNSHHYHVADIARNGLIRIAHFNPVTSEHDQLMGWHDPACFRRD